MCQAYVCTLASVALPRLARSGHYLAEPSPRADASSEVGVMGCGSEPKLLLWRLPPARLMRHGVALAFPVLGGMQRSPEEPQQAPRYPTIEVSGHAA